MMPMWWRAGRVRMDLSRPRVMGIVNTTPDSFSDGGRFLAVDQAVAHAARLVDEGADLIDLGAESTRPGALPVPSDVQWSRLAPVLREVLHLGCPVSVDTSHPDVMRRSLEAGADVINDVRALREPGALAVVAAHPQAGVCLMHMQGEPEHMQQAPHYAHVVDDVRAFLAERLSRFVEAGGALERVVLDPGFGFGKRLEHNLALAQGLSGLQSLGRPLLVGWSRKGTLGTLTGRALHERLVPSVAAALAAVSQGARVLRVHDVAATVDALKVWGALTPQDPPSLN